MLVVSTTQHKAKRHLIYPNYLPDQTLHNMLQHFHYLTLCILEAPKWVLLQTVKTQMKSSIMLHFIRVYTVCKDKKDP